MVNVRVTIHCANEIKCILFCSQRSKQRSVAQFFLLHHVWAESETLELAALQPAETTRRWCNGRSTASGMQRDRNFAEEKGKYIINYVFE